MKQIILSLALLFTMNSLFSQDIFKVGIVKGKHVTYEVKEQNIFPWGRIVKNAHNPDTSKAKLIYPFNLAAQIFDIEMQIEVAESLIEVFELMGCKNDETMEACARNKIPLDTGFSRPLEKSSNITIFIVFSLPSR